MRCQIVVAVDIAKMENVFVCKVSQGNSASKVIDAHEYKKFSMDRFLLLSFSKLQTIELLFLF